jgi:hypothetical protein
MSYDNMNSVSQNVLKFYQQLTGEERRIPVIFDDFHFCRSWVIGLDMTENRIFTLCRLITWVVFFRMFWHFISHLLVKRGGSLSFLAIFTFAVPELLDLIWRKIWFLVHLDLRSRWTIAITWRPSSVVFRLLSVVCKLFTFQASSPKPLGRLEPNLAGMFLGWSSTNFFPFQSDIQYGC